MIDPSKSDMLRPKPGWTRCQADSPSVQAAVLCARAHFFGDGQNISCSTMGSRKAGHGRRKAHFDLRIASLIGDPEVGLSSRQLLDGNAHLLPSLVVIIYDINHCVRECAVDEAAGPIAECCSNLMNRLLK